MRLPELLAPAGNFAKMKTALHFGADAVYLGLKQFSLRSFAGNFTIEELEEALNYAHSRGKKVYVALNMMPVSEDFKELSVILPKLSNLKPDGVIVSDPGVISFLRREAPELRLHLSTQANTLNNESVAFWGKSGIRRIVLARELSIEQIREIAASSGIELEVFVHGALCISYSGRCFLSLYMSGRDANRGECAQSCRWQYRVLEESERKGEYYPIEEDSRGSYIFNSKDLCALPLLPELVSSGVHSLKIEGRMKSIHYVGVTVDMYRRGLDILREKGLSQFRKAAPELVAELARVTNRGFTSNFLRGTPGRDGYRFDKGGVSNPYAFIGVVVGKSDEYLSLELKNPVRPGDSIELCDRGFLREKVTVEKVIDKKGNILDFGRSGELIRLNGRFKTAVGGLARK